MNVSTNISWKMRQFCTKDFTIGLKCFVDIWSSQKISILYFLKFLQNIYLIKVHASTIRIIRPLVWARIMYLIYSTYISCNLMRNSNSSYDKVSNNIFICLSSKFDQKHYTISCIVIVCRKLIMLYMCWLVGLVIKHPSVDLILHDQLCIQVGDPLT